jgi:hypothetical protein
VEASARQFSRTTGKERGGAAPEHDKSMRKRAVVNGNDAQDTLNATSDGAFAAIRIPACEVRLAPSQLTLLASLFQLPVALRGHTPALL